MNKQAKSDIRPNELSASLIVSLPAAEHRTHTHTNTLYVTNQVVEKTVVPLERETPKANPELRLRKKELLFLPFTSYILMLLYVCVLDAHYTHLFTTPAEISLCACIQHSLFKNAHSIAVKVNFCSQQPGERAK